MQSFRPPDEDDKQSNFTLQNSTVIDPSFMQSEMATVRNQLTHGLLNETSQITAMSVSASEFRQDQTVTDEKQDEIDLHEY